MSGERNGVKPATAGATVSPGAKLFTLETRRVGDRRSGDYCFGASNVSSSAIPACEPIS